jgi:hypothetical protein
VKRRLTNALIALFLTLAVLTAGLWVRSYWVSDRALYRFVKRPGVYIEHWVFSAAGVVGFGRDRLSYPAAADRRAPGKIVSASLATGSHAELASPQRLSRLGGRTGFSMGPMPGESFVCFPHWLPVLLLSAPPAAVLAARWRRRRRNSAGDDAGALPCPSCAYDLRATPDRCPECGTTSVKMAAP